MGIRIQSKYVQMRNLDVIIGRSTSLILILYNARIGSA